MAASYRLSYAGYHKLLQTENNIPYVYDDNRRKGDPPLARYEDARGAPTIGLGLKIDTAEEREVFRPYLNGRHAPKELIDQWNAKTVAQFEYDLNRKLDGVQLNPNQFDALFSLAWNRGVYSDVVKRVIDYSRIGDYEAAAHAILMGPRTIDGVVNQGLVKRRQEEATLFSTPWEPAPSTTTPTPANTSPSQPTWGSKVAARFPMYKDPFFWAHIAMGTIFFGTLIFSLRKLYGRDKHQEEYESAMAAFDANERRAQQRPSVPFGLETSPSTANPRSNPRRRPKKRTK